MPKKVAKLFRHGFVTVEPSRVRVFNAQDFRGKRDIPHTPNAFPTTCAGAPLSRPALATLSEMSPLSRFQPVKLPLLVSGGIWQVEQHSKGKHLCQNPSHNTNTYASKRNKKSARIIQNLRDICEVCSPRSGFCCINNIFASLT